MLGFGALGEFALGEGPNSQALGVSSNWVPPTVRRGLTAAVVATTFVGFVPPSAVQTAPPFTQFSQPSRLRVNQEAWRNAPVFQTTLAPVFAQFSVPIVSRGNLPDEQPSTLFEVLPPPSPPFTGFARFIEFLPKARINASPSFTQFTFFTPPDRRDGVFVKRKRKHEDALKLKLEEERSRRAAIELAFYGPPVQEQAPIEIGQPVIPATIDVSALASLIAAHENTMRLQKMVEAQAQEDDDIEAIMREIMS